jgi:hypothetical protein
MLLKILNIDPYDLQGISITFIGAFSFSLSYTYVLNKSRTSCREILYNGGVNPRDIMNNYAKEVTVELDITKLSQKTIALITEIFSIHRVGIFIFRGNSELPAYQNVLGFERNQIDAKELREIMGYWKTLGEDKVLIKGEIRKEAEEGNNIDAKRLLVLMEENKTNIIIPLNTKLRLSGLLILGAREDGEI